MGEFDLGVYCPSDRNRTDGKNRLGSPINKNRDVLYMFGDDPDPSVTTARVGSGTTFGRAREEGRWLTREFR